jgi:transposase
MHHRFKRKADKKYYGQRWQSETVNSMIKRNLGSALRARTVRGRSMELLLRVVTHNVMILQ